MPNIDEQEEFLRRKIDESTVDYSDKYWTDARQMLGTKRRRKFAWWWLPVILLPVVASVSYFGMKENNGSKQKTSLASAPGNDSSPFLRTASVLSSEKRKSSVSEQTYSATTNNSPSLNKNKKSGPSFITGNSVVPRLSTNVTKKEVEKTKASTRITNPSFNAGNKTGLKKSLSHRAASSSINTQNITSSSTNTIAANKAAEPEGESINKNETSNAQNNNPVIENTPFNNNSTTGKSLNDTVNFTLKQSTSTTEALANSGDTTKQTVSNSAAVAPIPAATNKVDTASSQPDSKNKFRNKILAISAGCNFNRGINATGSNSFTVGALPYAGASFALPVTPKISVQGGLIFNMYNQLHSETDIHHSNYYGFGYGEAIDKNSGQLLPYSDTVFSLHQQLLFTLQLPVVFNYYINGKNSFSLGAGIAYTMGIYSKVINFNGTETKSFGYSQGYRPLNAFLQAGYCYNLTKNWAVELNIQQGLTDMTDDAFFNSSRKDRFTNLQIGLKHEFAIKPKKTANEKK